MAITLVITTTKPADKLFFGDVSPENKTKAQEHDAWTASQPGFISQQLVDIDSNTKQFTIVFDNVENYANWYSTRLARDLAKERTAYNRANGMIIKTNEMLT